MQELFALMAYRVEAVRTGQGGGEWLHDLGRRERRIDTRWRDGVGYLVGGGEGMVIWIRRLFISLWECEFTTRVAEFVVHGWDRISISCMVWYSSMCCVYRYYSSLASLV